MDEHLMHGDAFGLCAVDAPLRLGDRGGGGR
jgi:hypothetical protein